MVLHLKGAHTREGSGKKVPRCKQSSLFVWSLASHFNIVKFLWVKQRDFHERKMLRTGELWLSDVNTLAYLYKYISFRVTLIVVYKAKHIPLENTNQQSSIWVSSGLKKLQTHQLISESPASLFCQV